MMVTDAPASSVVSEEAKSYSECLYTDGSGKRPHEAFCNENHDAPFDSRSFRNLKVYNNFKFSDRFKFIHPHCAQFIT